MRIIDAHLHFAKREGLIKTAKEIGQLDYSARGLRQEFAKSGVAAGIVMATAQREEGQAADNPLDSGLADGTLDCLLYCVGVNPEKLKEGNEELCYIENQLKKNIVTGIKIYAGYFPYYVGDPVYEPIYELAQKYGVPVAVHCGDTQSAQGILKYAHPLTLDETAVKHQDVTFIICHMGIPWVMDTAELIAKNENVYTDLSGLIAGNRAQIETVGSERLYVEYIQQGLVYADAYHKVLYGSDWPLVPLEPYIGFIKNLIPERHHEDVFYGNALKVYPRLRELIKKLPQKGVIA